MNVGSSTTSSNKPSSGKGFSGMASGIDTDAMVEAMLSGTQSKIDKQNVLLKQTTARQKMYRSIIENMNTFKSKYFDILNPKTNIMSPEFFKTMAASSTSTAFKVFAENGASMANTKIDIAQLASATKITSKDTASSDIEGTFKLPAAGETATISVNFNGINKDITISGDASKGTAAEQFKKGLDKAFGEGNITVTGTDANFSDGKFKLSTKTKGHEITLTGSAESMKALGINSTGVSNKINLNFTLKNAPFKNKISGNTYAFTINGVEIKGSTDESVGNILSKINASDAGVKATYDSLTDTFSMERTSTGKGFGIEMSQTDGNVLSSMFGVGAGSKYTSGTYTTNNVSSTGFTSGDGKVKEGSFTLNVNGGAVTISIPKKKLAEGATEPEPYTDKELLDEVNKQLGEKFGKGKDGNANIVLNANGTMKVQEGFNVSVAKQGNFYDKDGKIDAALVKSSVEGGNLNAMFGLVGGQNNAAVADTDASTIYGIGAGATGKFKDYVAATPGLTLNENGSITADSTVAGFDKNNAFVKQIFGDTTFGDGTDTGANYTKTEGKNAVVAINGVVTERSSNTFTTSGLTFTLTDVTDPNLTVATDASGNVTGINGLDTTKGTGVVEVSRNTDKIMDGIKSFVEDYNKLIKDLNEQIGQDKDYKKYPPLTDAQKKEMSDKEIAEWEKKSETGLLANDKEIQGFLEGMRTALYSRPEGSNIALYDIGIETGNWKDKGQLVIDEDKLRAAIEKDADGIAKLFTSKDGLATKMNSILDQTAKKSSASPGSLVTLAGAVGTAKEKENDLSKRMEAINKQITSLKRSYELEKARYWKQFNAMEQVVSNSSSQSSWLSQM